MELWKLFALIGVISLILALYLYLGGSFQGLNNMPLNFHWESEHTSFYFPLGTCLLISIIGSLILYLLK
jgi:hypothetical protein